MAEKEVRKTTARKTVRRTASKTVPRKAVTTQRTATAVRKAPARTVAPTVKRKSPKMLFVSLFVCVAIAGIGVAIGHSDGGEIDVSSVISNRTANATPEEREVLMQVPVQQTQTNVVNGGLVGAGKARRVETPAVVPETASSTASSTDAVAEGEVQGETSSEPVEAVAGDSVDASTGEAVAP